MDDLLTPVKTTYLNQQKPEEPLFIEAKQSRAPPVAEIHHDLKSADGILGALKTQPDYSTLVSILRILDGDRSSAKSLHLSAPGPKNAAITHVLVTEILPNYWVLLREGSDSDDGDFDLLVRSLRTVASLNAMTAQLKAFVQELRQNTQKSARPDLILQTRTILDALSAVLEGDSSLNGLWMASIAVVSGDALQRAQTQALLSLITNGKLVSLSAEALQLLGPDSSSRLAWLASGAEYSQWVGNNVASWAASCPEEAETRFCFNVMQRSMSLGYSDSLLKVVIQRLLLTKGVDRDAFVKLCFEQTLGTKRIMQTTLDYFSKSFKNKLNSDETSTSQAVSSVAGIIDNVVKGDQHRKNFLIDWCSSSSGAGLGDAFGIRRAVVAVLAKDKEAITMVLEKSISQFGDELYIKHAAILQQEVHVQVLLLSAGYVSRLSPVKLIMVMRSGTYLRAVSNRIASTQARTRLLGMVVAESMSSLTNGKTQQLNFKMEETDNEESRWYKSLTQVSDDIGSPELLLSKGSTASPKPTKPVSQPFVPKQKPERRKIPAVSQPSPKAIIEEIDSSDEDDDLVPYNKDSDPEDSDDDPTMVQRNKVKPPVYIRDLITFLRDSESYDKQKLALQTAPLLIRRKANFGTEVSSHADELASLLVGVQDKFEIEDFDNMRLQGMIALVVAQPKILAPWFARTFFEGDYSLSQRTSVLVTLGLSARELAGFETSSHQSAAQFPSKRLPEKMEQLYIQSSRQSATTSGAQLKALPATSLDTITQSLTQSFLAPLAAEAADATTGPDVLKLQTFTARYKSKSKAKPRVRAIPNVTAALLAASFFSPLTAHFQVALRSSKPLILNPALLALYLQTLGILIHSAGPSTLSLPQLTSELWDLLLGVRVHVLGDTGALRGWLVAMAAMLEANEGDMRRVCEAHGREILETREWVGGVFERTRGDDGGEENEVKMLAAGVLITLGEAVEKYQALLMGDMIGFG